MWYVFAPAKPTPTRSERRYTIDHRAIPEHRQIEAMSAEGNQLRKQLADLFDKIAYQLGFGPLPYLPPTFPASWLPLPVPTGLGVDQHGCDAKVKCKA
jgi:hypothetical protein